MLLRWYTHPVLPFDVSKVGHDKDGYLLSVIRDYTKQVWGTIYECYDQDSIYRTNDIFEVYRWIKERQTGG